MDYARTRSQGGFPITQVVAHQSADWTDCSNPAPRYYTYPFDCSLGEQTSFSDYVTPGFHRKVAKGQVFFKPMFKEKIVRSSLGSSNYTTVTGPWCSPAMNMTYTQDGPTMICCWLIGALKIGSDVYPYSWGNGISDADWSSLTGEVITKCMASRQSGSANFTESLAEMDKTWAMMVDPLVNARKFVRGFSAGSGKSKSRMYRGEKYTSFASSEYLRFRYGIKPLMNDVKAALRAIRTIYDVVPKRYTARANAQMTGTTSQNGTYAFGHAAGDARFTSTWTHRVSAMWLDSYRRTPWTELGFTFHNVVGVTWELTHFSFVLDWFVNVGDLIYANLPRVGVDALGGSVTHFDDTKNLVEATSTNATITPNISFSGSTSDTAVYQRIQKYRQRNTGETKLVVKSDFRMTNWTRASDAVALLLQQLNRIDFKLR